MDYILHPVVTTYVIDDHFPDVTVFPTLVTHVIADLVNLARIFLKMEKENILQQLYKWVGDMLACATCTVGQ